MNTFIITSLQLLPWVLLLRERIAARPKPAREVDPERELSPEEQARLDRHEANKRLLDQQQKALEGAQDTAYALFRRLREFGQCEACHASPEEVAALELLGQWRFADELTAWVRAHNMRAAQLQQQSLEI